MQIAIQFIDVVYNAVSFLSGQSDSVPNHGQEAERCGGPPRFQRAVQQPGTLVHGGRVPASAGSDGTPEWREPQLRGIRQACRNSRHAKDTKSQRVRLMRL